MEYRVLGKLEVLRDGHPVDLGAFRQRALLALLLTAPNSVFSTDQILDELWGDGAAPTSRTRCGSTCRGCARLSSRIARSGRKARSC